MSLSKFTFVVDGVEYHNIHVLSVKRSFAVLDGSREILDGQPVAFWSAEMSDAIGQFAQTAEFYDKIVLRLKSTSLPYRYAKLSRIDFGVSRTFERDELRDMKVVEEVSIIKENRARPARLGKAEAPACPASTAGREK